MHNPLFSIITPVHNGVEFLDTLISKLDRQLYPRWELIVAIDDPSDLPYARFARHPKIKFAPRKSRETGPGLARNDAFAVSIGDYIVKLDVDDWLRDDYLLKFALFFRDHPERLGALAVTRVVDGESGDSLYVPNISHRDEIDIETYSRIMVSTHVVCHRNAHVPWTDARFAEDALRDATLVYQLGTMPILNTEYIALIHPRQYTRSQRLTEEEIRHEYLRMAMESPGVEKFFLYRLVSNHHYDARRKPGQDWYAFWAEHANEVPSIEEHVGFEKV